MSVKSAGVLCLNPILQLVEIYRGLYSPHRAGDWVQLAEAEAVCFAAITEKYRPESRNNSVDYTPGEWIVIGAAACKAHGVNCAASRLQLIAPNFDLGGVAAVLDCKMTELTAVSVTYDISDFRLVRHTVSRKGVIVCDVFNSAEYELIPYIVRDGRRFGSVWVLLRFMMVDEWARIVRRSANTPTHSAIAALRNIGRSTEFAITDYIGVYIDDITAKKKKLVEAREAGQGGIFPIYYPRRNYKTGNGEIIGEWGPARLSSAAINLTDMLGNKMNIMQKFSQKKTLDSAIADYQSKEQTHSAWGLGKTVDAKKYRVFDYYIPDKIGLYVDIGCGSGLDAVAIRKKYRPGRIILTDIEDTRDAPAEKFEFALIKPGKQLAIADGAANLVTVFHSIHHMLDDVDCRLADIARITRVGGIVLVKDHDVATTAEAHDVDFEHFVYMTLDHPVDTLAADFSALMPMVYYSAAEIADKMEALGFERLFNKITAPKTHVYSAVFVKR